MINLSPHFTLDELTFSEYGQRHGISNEPDSEIVSNLQRTAALLEQVRAISGQPLVINSGYRSQKLNRLLGGVSTSAHIEGRAADFKPLDGDCSGLARKIAASSGLLFDQLILEYGWIHISVSPKQANPRMELLTKASASSPYVKGIA